MLLKPFLQFFYKGTVLQAVVSVPTALIFAPLPTLFRFFASPVVRWAVFVQKELVPYLRKTGAIEDELAEDDSEAAAAGSDDADDSASKKQQPKKKEKADRDLDKMREAAATSSGGGGSVDAQLRKRKAKKVSKADIEAEKVRLTSTCSLATHLLIQIRKVLVRNRNACSSARAWAARPSARTKRPPKRLPKRRRRRKARTRAARRACSRPRSG